MAQDLNPNFQPRKLNNVMQVIHYDSTFFLCCNVRSSHAHAAEVEFLANAQQAHIVLLQELWLDPSHPNPTIPGFQLSSRRDRGPGPNRGGLLMLVRSEVKNFAHVCHSEADERSWHVLHTDLRSIACLLYTSDAADE